MSKIIKTSMLFWLCATPVVAQNFSIEGTTPKYKAGDFQISLTGRAIFDTYDYEANFGEVVGNASRDEAFNNSSTRRIIWSLDGKLSPNWKFKTEHGFMGGKAQWTDAFLEYSRPNYSIYLGANHQTSTIEGQSSSATDVFAGRSLITNAFAHGQRNVGISYRYFKPDWQIALGYYGDNINQPSDRLFARSQFIQARASISPFHSKEQNLHLGASFRYRFRDDDGQFSYSTRAENVTNGAQFLQTGSIASEDLNFGLEALYSNGPFYIQGEWQLTHANTLNRGLDFSGGYVQAVYFITAENVNYNATKGVVGFVKPKKSIFQNGMGALSLVGRVDYLDLSDGELGQPNATNTAWRNRGGEAWAYTLGVNWHLAERIILRATYSQTEFENTRGFIINGSNLLSNPIGNGNAKIFNIRTQIGF